MANPIPDAALEHHVAVVGKTGSGKSYAAQGIVELLIHRKDRACIIDPTDRYWGLRLSADGKKPSGFEPVIFGGQYADLPLSAAHGGAIAETVGTTTTPVIIATRLMTVGERTRFFTDFAEALLRKNSGPLHLVIDEAHLFMPQAGARVGGAAPAMLHAGNNLVSLGRGIGLRIILLSQRPAKLHKDALTQVETLVSFRLIAPQDRNAIREWVKEWADEATGAEMMTSLPSLPTGTAWVWAPELDVLQKSVFPTIVTYDSGKPLAAGRKGLALKPIDLADVRGKLEAVAKEAVENDPRRLKSRVAELEKQLRAKANAAPDPDVLEKRYQAGVAEGIRIADAASAERIRDLQYAIDGALGYLLPECKTEDGMRMVTDARPRHAPAPVVQQVERAAHNGHVAGSSPAGRTNDGTLPKGERACLAAAAQHSDGVTRQQLTILTGYKRSTRDAYVQRLRDRGYITQMDGRLFSTPEGDIALGADFERLPIGDALREHWLVSLPEGERRVLEAAIGVYPGAVTRAQIDEATGFKRSTRDAYLQRLRVRELIEAGSDGVRAVDMLFGAGDA